MNAMKSLLAVSILAVAAGANAAQYNITGSQTNLSCTGNACSADITNTPTPTFDGVFDLTTSAFNSGNIAFDPYSVGISVAGGFFTATISNPNSADSIVGGTFAYNPGSLTLTLTDATGTFTGTTPTCTGAGVICDAQPNANIENLDLTLTFADASLQSFTGSIAALNDNGANGTSTMTWSFSGTQVEEVPLPAAAWLFGSGLIGLAGAVRRRRAAA